MFMGYFILFWLKIISRIYNQAIPLYAPVYTRVFPTKGLPDYNKIKYYWNIVLMYQADYHGITQCTIFNCKQGIPRARKLF